MPRRSPTSSPAGGRSTASERLPPHRRLPRDGQGGAHRLRAPFALTGMFLAAREVGARYALPPARTVFYIVLAMVGARTAAMGFNRLVDAEIDAKNPRTRGRAIPSGQVSGRWPASSS